MTITWALARTGLLVATATAAASCVFGGQQQLTIEPEAIPPATAGSYYEVVFRAGGALLADELPVTLELMPVHNAYVLFGVPTAPGSHTFDLTAAQGPTMFTDAPKPLTRTYTLTVDPPAEDSGLLFIQESQLTFTASEPISFDLKQAVRGGQPPYQFAAYCAAQPAVCSDAVPVYEQPRGVSLSEDGLLTGTIGPYTAVPAQSSPRSYVMFLCVTDAAAAHACESIRLIEDWQPGPPTTPPAAT